MDPGSKALRLVVLYNRDYDGEDPSSPDYSACADVLRAARYIADTLRGLGHHVELDGVDSDCVHSLPGRLRDRQPDLVFNLVESLGRDGRNEVVVPALLDLAGIPYTGSGPLALGLALRKDQAKYMLRAHGVPTPDAVVLRDADVSRVSLPFPLIVKPAREDASVGIDSASVVHDHAALAERVRRVVEGMRQPALVERYVEGRELYVSLLGNHPPRALPMHEIDFSAMPAHLPHIVSYAGKWDEASPEYAGTRPDRCILDEVTRLRVEAVAVSAFEALGLSDYGRIDVRLTAAGEPWVIDVNPNCDLSNGAGFSRAASYGGLDYGALIERICHVAVARNQHERARALSVVGSDAALG